MMKENPKQEKLDLTRVKELIDPLLKPLNFSLDVSNGLKLEPIVVQPVLQDGQEFIQAAAILKNGKVSTPAQHVNIIEDVAVKGAKHGFVTSTGRFVSGEEAAIVAYKARQIEHPKYNLTINDLLAWQNKQANGQK
jgi:hypothetical protein